jgi:hypothetical protein
MFFSIPKARGAACAMTTEQIAKKTKESASTNFDIDIPAALTARFNRKTVAMGGTE